MRTARPQEQEQRRRRDQRQRHDAGHRVRRTARRPARGDGRQQRQLGPDHQPLAARRAADPTRPVAGPVAAALRLHLVHHHAVDPLAGLVVRFAAGFTVV